MLQQMHLMHQSVCPQPREEVCGESDKAKIPCGEVLTMVLSHKVWAITYQDLCQHVRNLSKLFERNSVFVLFGAKKLGGRGNF